MTDDQDTTQPPAHADDVTLPPTDAAPAPAVLRKDPARRERAGLGTVAAGLAVAAAVIPVIVVAALLWPGVAPAPAAPTSAPAAAVPPPALDFAGLKAAVTAMAAAPSGTSVEVTSQAPLVLDPARMAAPRALMKRIAKARDVRREAGAAGPDLKKPFTVEELGGAAALKELGVEAGKRLLVGRDGKLVAPAAARLPEPSTGTLVSKERDEDVLETDATLAGAPVRVMRRCVGGELLCVVDIEPAAGTPPPAVSPSPSGLDARAAVLARIATEEQKLAAWSAASPSSPAAPTAPTATATSTATSTAMGAAVPPALALVLGLVLALGLSIPVARRLLQTSSWIVGASTRLRAGVAGRRARALSGARSDVPAELAALDNAIDDAFEAMGDAEARAALDEKRRARASALAAALDHALDALPARVDVDLGDDVAFAEVAASARRLVEAMEQRIVRWKSHVDVVTAPPVASRVEERAQALAPLPPLLVDAAQRLLLVARLPDVPPKAAAELNALADALAVRGRTAQGLLDALLLDAATDRPGVRPGSALEALKGELGALANRPSAPTAVAALDGLPPAEIAARLTSERAE